MKILFIIIALNFSNTFSQTDSINIEHQKYLLQHNTIEILPKIIGGNEEILNQIKYPGEALKNRIAGKIYLSFIVDTLGNSIGIEVIKGIGFGCDEEAIRVLKNIKFTPAITRGKKIPCLFALPIIFKLPHQVE